MKNFLTGSTRNDLPKHKVWSGVFVVYQTKESGSCTIDIGTLTGIGTTFTQAVQDLTEQIKEDDDGTD